jgi:hypothetical protein
MLKSKSSAKILCLKFTDVMKNVQMEQAGAELEQIVGRSLRLAPPDRAPVLAWPVVCGSAVAERTRAIDFADGILRVDVADAGWKRELQGLAPRYVAIINRYVTRNVQNIEFIVAPTRATVAPHKG